MSRLIAFTVLVFTFVSGPMATFAQTMDTPAQTAILIEANTGTILFEKGADEPFPPASMAKMMTVYIAFEMIKNGELRMDDTTIVSDNVWREWRGPRGSSMFLEARDEVTISDILRGIIVQSGNDATDALAEHLAGSVGTFVEWMNAKAEDLGMTNTHFENTNGWPAEGQYVTARDMATLAMATINNFPELYEIYAETSFTYGTDSNGNPITQGNRNPILYSVEGADGLKTGHTEEAGYGLTGSAIRDGRRIVMVVSGLDSIQARARESQRLMEYAFRNFKTYDLFAAGDVVEEGDVWLGESGRVPLVAPRDISLTLSRAQRNRMDVVLSYETPIPAPIQEGQEIATLTVRIDGENHTVVPLEAGHSVDEISGFGRISAAFAHLLFGASAAE